MTPKQPTAAVRSREQKPKAAAQSGERGPTCPTGLSVRAGAFWRRTAADFDLSDGELELLAETAWLISEVDALRAALDVDGLTVQGSTGQVRVHPAVNEVRQHRMALARLLKQLDLPAQDDEPESWTTKNARAAAQARWDNEKGRRRGTA